MKLKKYFLGISVIFLVFQQGFLSLGLKTLGGASRQRYRRTPGYLLPVTLLKLQGGMSLAHTAGHLLLILLLIEARKTLGSFRRVTSKGSLGCVYTSVSWHRLKSSVLD